jgi:hypothetical protein
MTKHLSRLARTLAAAVALGIVGWLDYRTHYEIGWFVLYALPLAWVAWSANFTWAFLLCLLDAVGRSWTDSHWVHHFDHAWISWERGGMRLIVLTFIVFSFHQFKRDLEKRSQKVRQLEGILPVCIACNRISDAEGNWTDLETYLRRHSEATPEVRLCPDCAGGR